MYCPKCGQYSDGSDKFCGACGSPLTVATGNNAVEASTRTSLMVWGIVATALAVYFPIVGIVISIIARNKVNTYRRLYGECTGKAKVGETLSLVALILSIALTVLYTVIFIVWSGIVWGFLTAVE